MNKLIIIIEHKDDKWWEKFKEVDVNLLEEIKRNSPDYSAIFITEETIITMKDKKMSFDGRHLLLILVSLCIGFILGVIQQKFFKD